MNRQINTRSKAKVKWEEASNKADSSGLLASSKNFIKEKYNLNPEKDVNLNSVLSVDSQSTLGIKLSSKNENEIPQTTKDETLGHADNMVKKWALSPAIKENEINPYDKFQNKIEEIHLKTYNEIKQEPISEENHNYKSSEFSKILPLIYKEIKQEPELVLMDDGTIATEFFVPESSEKLQNFSVSNEMYADDQPMKQLHDVEKNFKVSGEVTKSTTKEMANIDTTNNDIQVVFEIEDSDDEVKKELMDVINKYVSENPIQDNIIIAKIDVMQEALPKEDDESDDEEVETIVEILSDDDKDDPVDVISGKYMTSFNKIDNSIFQRETEKAHPVTKCLKRTSNDIEDNLPSGSNLATSHSQTTKKVSSKFPETVDLTKLTIKNNVEAFKYLYCIKKFFTAQNDLKACKLVSKLMMRLLICNGPLNKYTPNS